MENATNRTVLAILKVLEKHEDGIVGSREISRELKEYGVELTERTVRYHLKILDERGLTKVFGKEGRKITDRGKEELLMAHVSGKIGFIISKIENLSFRSDFDLDSLSGRLVINVSFFPEKDRPEALKLMKKVFASPYVMSDRVVLAGEGERIGDVVVPGGKFGMGTVCSVTINGIFLKAGIPVTSKFGGVMQVDREGPARFVSLISYEGSSLDPHLVFIKSRMTSVLDVVRQGRGNVLASFREIPLASLEKAHELEDKLRAAGIGGIVRLGAPNAPLLEVPVGVDHAGMVVVGGLNPVAALEEAGISTESKAMSILAEYSGLMPFKEAAKSGVA